MAFIIVDSNGPAQHRLAEQSSKTTPYLAAYRSPAQLLLSAGRHVQLETSEDT